MPRNLRYFHMWENCYYSTYGRDRALRYAEEKYCQCGIRYFLHNNQEVVAAGKCNDWHKCKGLDKVLSKGIKFGRK